MLLIDIFNFYCNASTFSLEYAKVLMTRCWFYFQFKEAKEIALPYFMLCNSQ